MAKFGLVMVEMGAFISKNEEAKHYSTDRKGGAVHFVALKSSTREEALKEVDEALDYHGGLVHTSTAFDEPRVYPKWSHLFLVESVEALPLEEWAKTAEEEFWRGIAEEKEAEERAEFERLKEKYGDQQEA